jgi:hypothetical protein
MAGGGLSKYVLAPQSCGRHCRSRAGLWTSQDILAQLSASVPQSRHVGLSPVDRLEETTWQAKPEHIQVVRQVA